MWPRKSYKQNIRREDSPIAYVTNLYRFNSEKKERGGEKGQRERERERERERWKEGERHRERARDDMDVAIQVKISRIS